MQSHLLCGGILEPLSCITSGLCASRICTRLHFRRWHSWTGHRRGRSGGDGRKNTYDQRPSVLTAIAHR
jgi:hypothetical protein